MVFKVFKRYLMVTFWESDKFLKGLHPKKITLLTRSAYRNAAGQPSQLQTQKRTHPTAVELEVILHDDGRPKVGENVSEVIGQ